jgi:trimeric autotransporter adhesin
MHESAYFRMLIAAALLAASGVLCADAQSTTAPATQAAPVTPAQSAAAAPSSSAVTGGTLHGVIKSGSVALPGVTITATNTLTGKKFATTTDIDGAWSMTIPQNGRYVLRTQFAAFAASTHEALLNANSHDQAVDFDLTLASRAAQLNATQDAQGQTEQIAQAVRQLTANGAQSLSLLSSLGAGTDAAEGGSTASGAALPGAATSSASGTDSVAINGQSGTVSPLAGVDMDRVRDAMETARAQGGGGFFGGQDFGGGGGFGGFGGPGGGGRGSFRAFRPDQPHGAIFWTGSNSALNALPFALRGQQETQPNYGSNRFGLTFMGEPFIPKLTKPSGKDTVFFTLSGSRTSTPFNQYAIVPTEAQRVDTSASTATMPSSVPCPVDASGNPVLSGSVVCNIFSLFPMPTPNLPPSQEGYNYYFASTAQSNSTQAGVRYIRSLGKNATLPNGRGGGGGGGRRGRTQNQGLRQSINANFNWSDSAADNLNIFPQLGGKTASHSYSLQTGYSLGYHRWNSNLTGGWNRSMSQAKNFFTNTQDIASELGVCGSTSEPGACVPLNESPLNYGVPRIVLSGSAGLSEQQPSFSLQQTISLSEVLSYGRGKHNYRFGGDFRRVHQDILGSGNATGTFYFIGDTADDSIAALQADQPAESTIQAAITKSYLRQDTWDLYAQDDFRAFSNLTLNYGIRYEFFSPYSERNDHLADLASNPGFTELERAYPGCASSVCGSVPSTLVYPFRTGVAPRVGLALRLPKTTVVRAGFGINYTNGQYSTFARAMAHQPPFANVQTNVAATTPISLSNGFVTSEADQRPNYSLEPHYSLPYVQVWNIDVQKTLPWGILLNAGYNGSKGNHLDVTTAPIPCGTLVIAPGCQTLDGAPVTIPVLFNYEQAHAFSKFGAGTLRLRKRLQKGVSMGINYTYSHSIDDAGSVGGTSTVVAQDWTNFGAEESNSSFDQRHKATGDYLFELPFGKDKRFLTSGGFASKALEGMSVSGTFTFATGLPLTPVFQASETDILANTAGTERPNRTGQPINVGGGSLTRWFNTGAFDPIAPASGIGNASRNSIRGPGTISNAMSLSKTENLGDTRSFEVRATASNVFNTVQYAGVDTNVQSPTFGQVTSAAGMRSFTFIARFRF